MTTECEAELRNKKAIQKLQVDLGNGVINIAQVLGILRGDGECSCAA